MNCKGNILGDCGHLEGEEDRVVEEGKAGQLEAKVSPDQVYWGDPDNGLAVNVPGGRENGSENNLKRAIGNVREMPVGDFLFESMWWNQKMPDMFSRLTNN